MVKFTDFLVRVNSLVHPHNHVDTLRRQLNFLSYELRSATSSYEDKTDRLKRAITYFFEEKLIRGQPLNKTTKVSDILVENIVNEKRGCSLTVSMLLKQMCDDIDVKLDIVSSKGMSLLKFVDKGKSFFIDVVDQRIISTEEILVKINSQLSVGKKIGPDWFENKSADELILIYLRVLKLYIEEKSFYKQLVHLYDLILELKPTSFRDLGERAQLLRRLGQDQVAKIDLARYFHFMPDTVKNNPELDA